MTHFPVRKAAMAAAVSVALLSGCTAAGWVTEAPPAAGTQAELSSLETARNMMFVVDETGSGVLLGSITAVDAAEVTGITYSAETKDGALGAQQTIEYTAEIPRQGAVKLEGPELAVTNPELTPGRLAAVSIQFAGKGTLDLKVPVYASDHPDFEEAWKEAAGA